MFHPFDVMINDVVIDAEELEEIGEEFDDDG
jgi:hypothetical protein